MHGITRFPHMDAQHLSMVVLNYRFYSATSATLTILSDPTCVSLFGGPPLHLTISTLSCTAKHLNGRFFRTAA